MRQGLNIEGVIRQIRALTLAAMEEIRHDAVLDLKQLTGTQGPPRSLPGEAPHMDTQALNRSTTSLTLNQGDTITAIVAEDTPYVLALEFGYPENNLQPRPHMSVELERTKNRSQEILVKYLSRLNAGT
jgi:hypothetical protein